MNLLKNILFPLLQVAMAGDFILAVASMMIARLRSDDVTLVLSQVIIVRMQLCDVSIPFKTDNVTGLFYSIDCHIQL